MGDVVTSACALLRRLEGLRLQAYPDPATGGAPWTIGYGATGPDIRPGTVWTRKRCEDDLAARVGKLAAEVGALVKVPLPDESKAALVSLAYNVGIGAFSRSTLLRRINAGETRGAADEFAKWVRAGGKVYAPLLKRRDVERKAYLAGLNAAGVQS
jgi:lysozyme